jgi:small GTP-binding protein
MSKIQDLNEDIIFKGRTELIFKVIFLGDSAVEKSSLLTKFAKNHFTKCYLLTVGVNILKESIYLEDDNAIINLLIWDIAGQPQFYMLHRPFFNGAEVVVFTFDIAKPSTFFDVNYWFNKIVMQGLGRIPRFLLGIKNNERDERKIILPMALHLSNKINAPYFETCSITGENLDLLFHAIAESIYVYKTPIFSNFQP